MNAATSNEVRQILDEIRALPIERKLEVACALWTDPRPHMRRIAEHAVRSALREMETQQ